MTLTAKQLDLLRSAADRADGLLIRPDGLGDRAAKTISAKLIATGCAKRTDVTDEQPARDETKDGRVGLHIAAAGWTAIGLEAPAPVRSAPARPQRITKRSRVLTLLRRPEGATLDDLIAVTGWLPHSTRAVLTGLRKCGYDLIRDSDAEGPSRYRLTATSASAQPAQSEQIDG